MLSRVKFALALLLALMAPSIAQDTPATNRIAAIFSQSQAVTQRSNSAVARPDNRLGPFKVDPEAPIYIEADRFVETFDGQVVFNGNVKLHQCDFLLRTPTLTTFYLGQFRLRSGDEWRAEQLTRVEAKRVLVTSKEGQTVTGGWAIFDIVSNTVLLGGGVTVTSAGEDPLKVDVARGERLKVDLTTGMFRFEIDRAPTSPQPADVQIKPQ